MSFSSKDIASFMDSDEVSEIDGIKLMKSHSTTHIRPEKKSYTKSVSFSPGHKVSLMTPNSVKSKSRYDYTDDSSSVENSDERRKKKLLRRQKREKDLLAMPIRDIDLAKKLLPEKSRIESEVSDESVSVGGTVRKKKKKRPPKAKEEQEIKQLIPLTEDKIKEEKMEKNQIPHSKEEISEMTDGFIVVPKSDWENLEPGSCIKWVNKYGRCITKEWYYWYQKTSKVTGTKFFYVGTYPTKAEGGVFQQTFAAFWDNIKILYKKEDPITKMLRLAIDKRQDYITDIAVFLKNKYGEEFENYMKGRATYRAKIAREENIKAKALAKEKKKEEDLKAQSVRNKYESSKKQPELPKPKVKPKPKTKKIKLVSVNKFKK